jgi:hypothetical protein
VTQSSNAEYWRKPLRIVVSQFVAISKKRTSVPRQCREFEATVVTAEMVIWCADATYIIGGEAGNIQTSNIW